MAATPMTAPAPASFATPSNPQKTPEEVAQFLWKLLDDIDTASDIAKEDRSLYISMVERIQRRRFEVGSTDGYSVKFPLIPPVPVNDGQPQWWHSFDARDWARAFVEHVLKNPSIATDEDTMVGWFANAIMRGYDEGQARAALSKSPPQESQP